MLDPDRGSVRHTPRVGVTAPVVLLLGDVAELSLPTEADLSGPFVVGAV